MVEKVPGIAVADLAGYLPTLTGHGGPDIVILPDHRPGAGTAAR
jgi:hypothetical protein